MPSSRGYAEEREERRNVAPRDFFRVESAPSASSFQDIACAVCDGVGMELRHVVNPERHSCDASRDDDVLLRVPDPRHVEVDGCEDSRHHCLDFGVFEQTDVFKVVGLLDVADRVLDLFRGDSFSARTMDASFTSFSTMIP